MLIYSGSHAAGDGGDGITKLAADLLTTHTRTQSPLLPRRENQTAAESNGPRWAGAAKLKLNRPIAVGVNNQQKRVALEHHSSVVWIGGVDEQFVSGITERFDRKMVSI